MLRIFFKSALLINFVTRSVSPVLLHQRNMNDICRKSIAYPVERFSVPDDMVSWKVSWPEYSPPNYSAPYLNTASWADPDITDNKFVPKWNDIDNGIDRRSFEQENIIQYDTKDGYPLNPSGRTGLCGRGRLGRWGPNHAGDAIVTRWKTSNDQRVLSPNTGKPILQFIAILRKDCQKWAIPGGFVDPKEASSAAVLRELFEEAINIEKLPSEVQTSLRDFFKHGNQVYRGYVDDPRNTDNAWIETTAINFHDDSGNNTNNIELDARDDATDVTWIDIVPEMTIYPPHYAIIKHLTEKHIESV